MNKLRSWQTHQFLHMKRDWNQSADRLASAALQQEKGTTVTAEEEILNLITLNRLSELSKPRDSGSVVKVTAVTRSSARRRRSPEILQEDFVQRIRVDRMRKAQEEERWIANLKVYLVGDIATLSAEESKVCTAIGDDYEVDTN